MNPEDINLLNRAEGLKRNLKRAAIRGTIAALFGGLTAVAGYQASESTEVVKVMPTEEDFVVEGGDVHRMGPTKETELTATGWMYTAGAILSGLLSAGFAFAAHRSLGRAEAHKSGKYIYYNLDPAVAQKLGESEDQASNADAKNLDQS